MRLSFGKAAADSELIAMVADSGFLELTPANFEQATIDHPALAVDFWAPWCAPCKAATRHLLEVAPHYAGDLVFGTVNVEQYPELRKQNHVWGVPTLLLFRSGVPAGKITGSTSVDKLRQKLDDMLGSAGR